MNNIQNAALRIKTRKWTIKASTIFAGLICLLMLLPDDFFGMICLYRNITPSYISYKWLNYNFGIIQLCILLVGCFLSLKKNRRLVFSLLIVMLLREIYFFVIGDNNIFSASSYEMYLTVFVGYSFVLCVEFGLKTTEEYERFFKWFLVTNVLTIYINYVTGGSGGLLEGRYHASNLDVGATGTLCVLCIILLGFSKTKKWHDYLFIGLSIIGLFLSGSRANLLFFILMMVLYYIINTFTHFRNEENSTNKNKIIKKLILISLILIFGMVIVIKYYDALERIILGTRFRSLISTQGISSDESVLGRSESLTAGLDVLKYHPFGISGYFTNLQQEIRERGFPTFPHSTFLSMYIIFGPVILGLYFKWIKMVKELRFINIRYFMMILFLLISTIVYGGPIVNFKIVFTMGMTTLLASNVLRFSRKD